MQKTKVWDGAVRLFHWSQLGLLGGLWYSAEQEWFGVHMMLAYSLASLLGARLIWALVGSANARWRSFIKSPATVWRWLRTSPKPPQAGHNPLSGYMVLALLVLVLLQFVSGLMTSDQILTEGPLVALVPSSWVELASSFHQWNVNLVLALVLVHVLAAVAHQLRGDRVISAMFSGNKHLSSTIANDKVQHLSAVTAPLQTQKFRALGWYLLLVVSFGVGFYCWQGDVVLQMLTAELTAE